MSRHELRALSRSGQCRAGIAHIVASMIAFASGCVPAEEGSATDIVAAGTGEAIVQFMAFISDFARQLLAAYLF